MVRIDRQRGDHAAWSNFHPAPVTLDGLLYPSVEHAFQAAKSRDAAEREAIRRAPTPGAAKRLGRRVALRPDWEEVKFPLMVSLLRQKFGVPGLGEALLLSGGQEIIEDTTGWHDLTWGRCFCPSHQGAGSNLLGLALMRVRSELAAGGGERGGSGVSQSIDTSSPPGSDQGSGEHLRVQAALPLEDDGPAATGVSARPLRGRWIEVDRYTRGDLRAHRDWVYIFGDNELGEGRGGQAGAARGEVNGLGIPTKRAPGTQASDYWSDATLAHNVAVLQGPLRRLENLILEGWTVVMPAAGVGTGLAMLPTPAPLTFAYLSHRLAALRSLAAAGDVR